MKKGLLKTQTSLSSDNQKKKARSFFLRLILVLIVDLMSLWFMWRQAEIGNYTIVVIVAIAVMFLSIVFLKMINIH